MTRGGSLSGDGPHWAEHKMRRRTILLIGGFLAVMLVATAYFRHAGLPVAVIRVPYCGRFLQNHIGSHIVIRHDGKIRNDLVTRGFGVPPPPPNYHGFWNVLASPKIIRGVSYDTNGAVIARVQDGVGSIATFDEKNGTWKFGSVSNGVPIITNDDE